MTKISLLGALYIPLLVKRWNESRDTDLKKNVCHMTMSENTLDVQNGLSKIFEIFYLGAAKNDFVKNIGYLNDFTLGTLFEPLAKEQKSAMIEKARSDVGFYFLSMFKLGFLEQLPMPDFFYNMESEIVLERRILSEDGKVSVVGPPHHDRFTGE